MISEGVNAWQKLVTKSRIHHHCSVATSTFRCAHRKPNLSQVPSDERFRQLFTASPNKVLVGADLSGIELRMLAHYLARYDQGRYSKILLTGDIHQTNADKIV
jgi:DNA polymerase I-like protein with 3'-5' exonuclease and polymerase domains